MGKVAGRTAKATVNKVMPAIEEPANKMYVEVETKRTTTSEERLLDTDLQESIDSMETRTKGLMDTWFNEATREAFRHTLVVLVSQRRPPA